MHQARKGHRQGASHLFSLICKTDRAHDEQNRPQSNKLSAKFPGTCMKPMDPGAHAIYPHKQVEHEYDARIYTRIRFHAIEYSPGQTFFSFMVMLLRISPRGKDDACLSI